MRSPRRCGRMRRWFSNIGRHLNLIALQKQTSAPIAALQYRRGLRDLRKTGFALAPDGLIYERAVRACGDENDQGYRFTKGRACVRRLWFDNPDNPGMTALYLERYLNYGLTREELNRASRSSASRRQARICRPATAITSNSPSASARASARPAASPSSSRSIRSRRPASARPPRSTATSPIWAWSRCFTAIRSTAWC